MKNKTKTVKEQYEIVLNHRNSHIKEHLTIDQQLKKLKSMNFTIDVDENLAKNYLSKESYVQFFKAYEDNFIENNNRDKFNIKINKFSKPKSITKFLKRREFRYVKNNFSELIKIKILDKTLRDYLLDLTYNIELVIKNTILDVIGAELGNESWTSWLLRISPPEFINKLVIMTYEYQRYKDSFYHVIQELSLGQLKRIIEIIFKSEKIDERIQKSLCKILFVECLGKKVYLRNPDYDFLIWKLTVLNRMRNYIAHGERFGRFLLKERLAHLQHKSKEQHLKFNFIKNNYKDLSINYFINNNDYKLLEGEVYDLLKEFKLGYYIEIHNKINGDIECLELKILEDLIWWFN